MTWDSAANRLHEVKNLANWLKFAFQLMLSCFAYSEPKAVGGAEAEWPPSGGAQTDPGCALETACFAKVLDPVGSYSLQQCWKA